MINATRWGRLNPAQRQPLQSGKGRIETQVIPCSREDNSIPGPRAASHHQAWVDVSEPGCALERRFSISPTC